MNDGVTTVVSLGRNNLYKMIPKLTSTQFFILIAISFLINCSPDKAAKVFTTADNVDTLFLEFVDSIRMQSLPLHISCGLEENLVSSTQFEKFKKYIPQSASLVFGHIKSTSDNHKLIIYGQVGDDIYPLLFSYDRTGKIMDSLHLMLTGCGGADETAIPHAFATISPDLTITLIDTTRLIHYANGSGSVDNYIIDSLRIKKVAMTIDKNGRFVKQ
jgi:hypothetical protein